MCDFENVIGKVTCLLTMIDSENVYFLGQGSGFWNLMAIFFSYVEANEIWKLKAQKEIGGGSYGAGFGLCRFLYRDSRRVERWICCGSDDGEGLEKQI